MTDSFAALEFEAAKSAIAELWLAEAGIIAARVREGNENAERRAHLLDTVDAIRGDLRAASAALEALPAEMSAAMLRADDAEISALRQRYATLTAERDALQARLSLSERELADLGRNQSGLLLAGMRRAGAEAADPARQQAKELHRLIDKLLSERIEVPMDAARPGIEAVLSVEASERERARRGRR